MSIIVGYLRNANNFCWWAKNIFGTKIDEMNESLNSGRPRTEVEEPHFLVFGFKLPSSPFCWFFSPSSAFWAKYFGQHEQHEHDSNQTVYGFLSCWCRAKKACIESMLFAPEKHFAFWPRSSEVTLLQVMRGSLTDDSFASIFRSGKIDRISRKHKSVAQFGYKST